MSELVYDQSDRLIEWAQAIIGCKFRPDATAIGRASDGEILVVAVFDGFSECDCNIHIASDGSGHALSRRFLTAAFAYPFIQLNMRRVTGLVPASNTKALKFDYHLGFVFEGRCRNALPNDDIIILGMLREECPFLPEKHRSQNHAQ